ncbi:MarR family winged helix-turn-helix transcriptional regulator [Epilithonimonas tenax]|uniref:MarR family winged helix-turn-helix transcriptional regulator n=1 Tax=Epilithonimonas tenax TaxID=191577 RepID=UPI00041B259B|nr:MarR family transcriptional regulator [Epilithonimonas tenax]
MTVKMIKDVIQLLEDFELENKDHIYPSDVEGFKKWISDQKDRKLKEEPIWEGKENGRSAEGVISTLLVHMNRYAKTYSKSAIADSDFHTQDEFSYLINLRAFAGMTKMELIKRNIHDKSSGILIINRLIKKGWIEQTDSDTDKRSKVLRITDEGTMALDQQMEKIRNASKIVTGNLNQSEKMELIRILSKLDQFHQPIFLQNIDSSKLIETVYQEYTFGQN